MEPGNNDYMRRLVGLLTSVTEWRRDGVDNDEASDRMLAASRALSPRFTFSGTFNLSEYPSAEEVQDKVQAVVDEATKEIDAHNAGLIAAGVVVALDLLDEVRQATGESEEEILKRLALRYAEDATGQ